VVQENDNWLKVAESGIKKSRKNEKGDQN